MNRKNLNLFVLWYAGGEMTSAKKLGGDKVRYQIMYKLEGKEHQITLGEDGARTKKARKDGDKEDAKEEHKEGAK
jgi:hypothetical protein